MRKADLKVETEVLICAAQATGITYKLRSNLILIKMANVHYVGCAEKRRKCK